VVSLSTGELRIDGTHAVYELRVPMYEITHVANPDVALLDHVRFAGARLVSSSCNSEGDDYVCIANYDFPRPMDRVNVECTLYQITVPNHVHMLRAIAGRNADQVRFDQSATRAELRLKPASAPEDLIIDLGTGAWRAIASPAPLFLLALVLAARSSREAVLLALMYLAGEWCMRPLAPRIPWPLAPRFVEAAMALTVAYLAVEILTLPKAGKRWLIVLVLGCFHGLYYASFPVTYLAGATFIQAALIAILAWAALRWSTPGIRRTSAAVLLAGGIGWFVLRLMRP